MAQRTDHRPARTEDLGPALARHRVEVARWALQSGHSLDLDAVTVLFGVIYGIGGLPEPTRSCWNRTWVAEILWNRAASWCEHAGVDLPTGTSEALWTYLTYLDEIDALLGDSLAELRAELVASAGLDRRGRLRHPSGGRRPNAEVRPLRRRPA